MPEKIEEQALTNAQFSIPNSHRMGIEHWELSIGQIVWFLITPCGEKTKKRQPMSRSGHGGFG